MNALYVVIGTSRERGALGTPDEFEELATAEDQEQAASLVRDGLYARGREHVHVVAVTDTFEAALRADAQKIPGLKVYRYLTLRECRGLNGRAKAVDRNGQVVTVKITSVTWGTQPGTRVGWQSSLDGHRSETIYSDEGNRFFVVEVKAEN
jgi:hypothetical protein